MFELLIISKRTREEHVKSSKKFTINLFVIINSEQKEDNVITFERIKKQIILVHRELKSYLFF